MKEKVVNNCRWLKKAAICLAFFAFLTANSQAGLLYPPAIAVQPLGVGVQNGGTAVLTATATSLTKMEITWRFNGVPITNAQVANVVVPLVGTVSTLTILNVSPANQGAYSMKVENGGGEVVSQDATLLVLGNVVTGVLNTVSVLTSGTGMTTNGFQLNLIKPATSNCVVDASANLKDWTPVYTNSTSSTNISYTDIAAKNMAFRYYRVRMQ